MKLYEVIVKDEMKEFYFPVFLHRGVGFIFDQDEEHVYFKIIRYNKEGKGFLSICRYVRDDVDISLFANFEDVR